MIIVTKVLLLCAVGYIAFVLIFRIQTILLHRILAALLSLGVAALVAFPDLSTRLAWRFGVGRGVDFLFYFAHVAAFYLILRLHVAHRENQRRITELVRTLALLTPRTPGT
jgi:hypothetical protein